MGEDLVGLRASQVLVEIAVEDPASSAARFCLQSYFAELDSRFDAGFDPDASLPAATGDLAEPAGVLLLARVRGEPAGCGALKFHGTGPAELKRMWVAPSARGLGVGRRILAELELYARQRGTTVLRLETSRHLTEAIGLYRSAGYAEVPAFNDEPYAHHWFEKHLTKEPARARAGPARRGAPRPMSSYLDYSGRDDVLSGGARMIPVDTPAGQYRVWVKRVGNNPDLRVLLLHGGPGATHEYLEACDSYLPAAGVEYYYYDQLGSGFSDQPEDRSLWDVDRFVDEVEQVRRALGLGRDNFVLYGQSWGGILAIEYALRYQRHLRGLVISNMMSSVPAYNAYAEQVLMPAMDQTALAEIKALEAKGEIENPRYMQLLNEQHYVYHVLRMPVESWPDPVQRGFAHINPAIYVSMQGPSELGISADAKLARWDRTGELASIEVPALVIGARYDTMDPAHMEMMAGALPAGRYLYCPEGSHLSMYDDQETYFAGLIDFLHGIGRP